MNLRELMAERPNEAQQIIETLIDDLGDEFRFDDRGILWAKVWSVESGAYECVMFWDESRSMWDEGSWNDSPWVDEP